jgi:glutaconate CoA-transferase subunit A
VGGNAQYLGSDPFMDDLFVAAAARSFVSAEKIIPTEDFATYGPIQTQRISRLHVTGVVEAPGGAHFTECPPDYGRDESFQRMYAKAAATPEDWAGFSKQWLELETEDDYQRAVQARQSGEVAR